MGLVLAFQSAPRSASRTTPRRSPQPPRAADILFFTGVRYERHADAASGAHAATVASAGREQPAS